MTPPRAVLADFHTTFPLFPPRTPACVDCSQVDGQRRRARQRAVAGPHRNRRQGHELGQRTTVRRVVLAVRGDSFMERTHLYLGQSLVALTHAHL